MLVYYFVPFIVSNRYLLFWVSNGHNSVTVQNRTHVYMNLFHHKDLGNHLLQLCPKVVKHSVYEIRELKVFQNVMLWSLGTIYRTTQHPIPGWLKSSTALLWQPQISDETNNLCMRVKDRQLFHKIRQS